jgi:allophanate hydrolase subunit 2
VLPSGDLVVLGPDAGVTGGYAVAGAVGRAGLDLLAQAAPGATLRFRLVTRRSPRPRPGAARGDRRQYQ